LKISVCNNKGITLVEIILVLVVMGIISTIITPNFLQLNDRWILRSTAYAIANDIRRVQRLSVQECANYNFEIHTKEFYYVLRNNDPIYPHIKKVYLDPKINYISSNLYNPGYGGAMEGYRILKFSYLGSPNQAGEIVLYTKNGNSIKLTVDVTTGRVKVYDK